MRGDAAAPIGPARDLIEYLRCDNAGRTSGAPGHAQGAALMIPRRVSPSPGHN
jgi:hypothetical protein